MNVYKILFICLPFLVFSCSGQTKQKLESTTPIEHVKLPMPENGFYCGFLDSKGNLWFGSRGNGVFKFDGSSFINYTAANGLCDNDISCITEDREGNIWFGTTSGVCKFDGKLFESVEIPKSDTSSVWLDKVYPVVNPNQVMSILEDSGGDLWFGTNGAGAYHYNGESFTQHLSDIGKVYDDGHQHNIVLSMIEDSKGNIWFTSLSHGGVSVYDGEGFTHYTQELSDDFIRVVFEDSKNNIWIGTHGNHDGGLDKYDGKVFTTFYKMNDGLTHNNVKGIYEDQSGLLWLASGTTELATFDGEHFRIFKDNHGKTYHRINFLLADKDGNIWFGNKHGLWIYDGETVIEVTRS
ncbi:ligand-binding sensor domain-containing protein [Fulvivirga ligni]|uniref:ligand-binding sensor domain-containing protein n=1 Tax=Fulvivirga ligni TaxID=2904246 RepID=UPI001F39D45A|nr:two-component regulator propeller domain-containing protein [Fulvivirga ligni]UII22217.1 hypothetical protein LVD16_03100 [Fulvivirga ligni]